MIKPYLNAVCMVKLKTLFSKRYLIYTNTCISIATSVTADLIQQNYQRLKNDETRRWEHERSAKMATVGFAFGPSVHYWYIFLDKMHPGRARKAVVIKVCLDQFIFSPFCIATFLIIVGLLEQQGLKLLKDEFRNTGPLLFFTDMVIWTPAQIINFYFVPMKYRVLYDNFVSSISGALYSYLRFERLRKSNTDTYLEVPKQLSKVF